MSGAVGGAVGSGLSAAGLKGSLAADMIRGGIKGTVGGGIGYITSLKEGEKWNWKHFGTSVGVGAGTGVIMGGATSNHLGNVWRGVETLFGESVKLEGYITPSIRVTSEFGWRTINGQADFHEGIDIGGQIPGTAGDPVYARSGGIITRIGPQNPNNLNVGFGNRVSILYENGLEGFYGHLESINPDLQVGDFVFEGQSLGTMGNSGSSTGVHLHYGERTYWSHKWINPRTTTSNQYFYPYFYP